MRRRIDRREIIIVVIPASRIGIFVLYEVVLSSALYLLVKKSGGNEWMAFGISAVIPTFLRKRSNRRRPLLPPKPVRV